MFAPVFRCDRPRLMFIHGEQALVEMRIRRQHRLIAQQDVQKRQLRNVTSQNDTQTVSGVERIRPAGPTERPKTSWSTAEPAKRFRCARRTAKAPESCR